jgi:hypothetical protein
LRLQTYQSVRHGPYRRFIANAGLRIISMSDVRHKKRELKGYERFLEKLREEDWVKLTEKNVEEICKLRFAYEKSGFPEWLALLKHDQQARVPFVPAAKSVRWQTIKARERRTDFKNAWIYEVVPRTLPLSGTGYHVAFIDDLDVDSDLD